MPFGRRQERLPGPDDFRQVHIIPDSLGRGLAVDGGAEAAAQVDDGSFGVAGKEVPDGAIDVHLAGQAADLAVFLEGSPDLREIEVQLFQNVYGDGVVGGRRVGPAGGGAAPQGDEERSGDIVREARFYFHGSSVDRHPFGAQNEYRTPR